MFLISKKNVFCRFASKSSKHHKNQQTLPSRYPATKSFPRPVRRKISKESKASTSSKATTMKASRGTKHRLAAKPVMKKKPGNIDKDSFPKILPFFLLSTVRVMKKSGVYNVCEKWPNSLSSSEFIQMCSNMWMQELPEMLQGLSGLAERHKIPGRFVLHLATTSPGHDSHWVLE